MTMHTRWTICAAAALLSAPFFVSSEAPFEAALAQGLGAPATAKSHPQWVAQARVKVIFKPSATA